MNATYTILHWLDYNNAENTAANKYLQQIGDYRGMTGY